MSVTKLVLIISVVTLLNTHKLRTREELLATRAIFTHMLVVPRFSHFFLDELQLLTLRDLE